MKSGPVRGMKTTEGNSEMILVYEDEGLVKVVSKGVGFDMSLSFSPDSAQEFIQLITLAIEEARNERKEP